MHINVARTSKYRNINPTLAYWNALGSTERVREGAVCCAVERCLSSPGRPGCWRGNQTCTSWQAERELCAGWTETWSPCFSRNAPLHQRNIFLKKGNSPRQITHSAFRSRLGGFTEIEEGPLHVVPPPSRFQQLHSLPLPRLVFPLPLRLLCSLARKRLNCQQLLSGLSVFWRCFPTAQLLCHSRRTFPCSNAQAKGCSCHKNEGELPPVPSAAAAI